MNSTFTTLSKVLSTVAPTLATMLLGPMAGTAVTALETAFGVGAGSGAEAITTVVQAGHMTPEIIAAVRAADQRHAEILGQQGLDLAKLNQDHAESMATVDAGDRDSARKREIAVRGLTTPALAWLVVSASIGLGAAIIFGVVTKDLTQANLVGTVIGYVMSEAKQVLAYYFGSSAGSDRKTELLSQAEPVRPT